MSDKIGPLLQWLNLHPNLTGLAAFIISASESIAIIGTIIPGTITMTAIGTLIGAGVIPLWSTIIWAILGAIAGDNISYWTGHYFKDGLRKSWIFRVRPQWLPTGEKFFYRYGSMSVLIGRFVGPIRAIVPIIAGMLGMRPFPFIFTSIIASIGWAPLYMLPGILIGEATLELPPDMAANMMLRLILTGLFILLCLWVVYRTFILIHNQINNVLNSFWGMLQRSRYFYVVTSALKHYDRSKTHGQIILAFYLAVVVLAFVYLIFYVTTHDSLSIITNSAFFYVCRSLRTPMGDNIMIFVTLLGDKKVLIPAIALILGWFAYKKHWRTVWHGIALFGMTAVSIVLIKHFTHIPRPWGIANSPENFSFPSGHTTVATTFYIGLALLFLEATNIRHKNWFYFLTGLLVITISFSRLYLGAHWFTDVLGGWLLSTIMLMLTVLSYNRHQENPLQVKTIFISLLIFIGVFATLLDGIQHQQLQANYTQTEWPTSALELDNWWAQDNSKSALPFYRIGRAGIPVEMLNLQWIGDLNDIQTLLLQQGWHLPPKRDWADVLHRITDIGSAEHLPLVSPLYLGKKPVLVLMKTVDGIKNPLVLRLWNSNINVLGSPNELWVGSVGIVPRTYSWLISYKSRGPFVFTPGLIFNNAPPTNYSIKVLMVATELRNKKVLQPLVLIKPKTPS
jgi:membrane protein DedA with SNARE-associated domain/membrane-associated phospholipid phosphatase